jgi:hypothetical protein
LLSAISGHIASWETAMVRNEWMRQQKEKSIVSHETEFFAANR